MCNADDIHAVMCDAVDFELGGGGSLMKLNAKLTDEERRGQLHGVGGARWGACVQRNCD